MGTLSLCQHKILICTDRGKNPIPDLALQNQLEVRILSYFGGKVSQLGWNSISLSAAGDACWSMVEQGRRSTYPMPHGEWIKWEHKNTPLGTLWINNVNSLGVHFRLSKGELDKKRAIITGQASSKVGALLGFFPLSLSDLLTHLMYGFGPRLGTWIWVGVFSRFSFLGVISTLEVGPLFVFLSLSLLVVCFSSFLVVKSKSFLKEHMSISSKRCKHRLF